jgi:hypothetical protein
MLRPPAFTDGRIRIGLTGGIACDGLGDCGSRRFEVHSHEDATVATLSELTSLWSTSVPR